MRIIWICMAVLAMFAPGASQAYAKTVICDGCGETEYTKTALRSAEGADTMFVIDGANAQLRKYRVSYSSEPEVQRFRLTVTRVSPNQQEWADFEETIRIHDVIRHYLDSCGPGGVGDYLVPDLNVSWACERHDTCYTNGGSDSDRARCDGQLYDDMLALGATRSIATIYFLAVRAAGWLYFNYSSSSLTNGWGSGAGCAYLEVCDYTDLAEIPR